MCTQARFSSVYPEELRDDCIPSRCIASALKSIDQAPRIVRHRPSSAISSATTSCLRREV